MMQNLSQAEVRKDIKNNAGKMRIFYVLGVLICGITTLVSTRKNKSIVYILIWTNAYEKPLSFIPQGQQAFIERNCEFQNCILTDHRDYLDDITDFDALLFNSVDLYRGWELPDKRSENQEYILVGFEPAMYFPVPESLNEYFNMTWTYKLNSDVVFAYIKVLNTSGAAIGPKIDMKWLSNNEMDPVSDNVLAKLKNKFKTGIWIVSNCNAVNRNYYIKELNKELEGRYDKHVDIFGACGIWPCEADIYDKIKDEYYFYMAFENSFAEDYVTEKILNGLHNYAVPVVYGSADYNRFMPSDIYLNAYELDPRELARVMNDIINFRPRYEDFFKWHSHYKFINTNSDNFRDAVCGLCAILNNKTRRDMRTYYKDISNWWTGLGKYKGPEGDVPEKEEIKEGGPISDFVDKLINHFFNK